MGATTAIAWTDHTFNPWWGCTRVSPGCDHCYAEAFAKRTGKATWGDDQPRRFFGDNHWREPGRWNAQAEAEGRRHRVFCASMADVFEDRPELVEHRDHLWDAITATPWLDWQLLTKRPENVLRLVDGWIVDPARPDDWPDNVWIGTTVEDQDRADERVPVLLTVPAKVRFLSCEPLLEAVDLDGLWGYPGSADCDDLDRWPIHWVIVGGESGAGHRALNLDHARSLRDQCEKAGVPFFFKQVGGRTPTAGGDELDGVTHKEFPEPAMTIGRRTTA